MEDSARSLFSPHAVGGSKECRTPRRAGAPDLRFVRCFTAIGMLLVAGALTAGPASAAPGWKFHADLDNSGVYDSGGIQPGNTLRWSFLSGDSISSSPAVVDGIVYIGSKDRKLHAVYASNGTESWNFTTGLEVGSTPAVTGGVAYFGSWDSKFYAVWTGNHTERWNFTAGDPIKSSPAVSGDLVFFGSYDNKVYALRTEDGSPAWNFTTGDEVRGSPAVANGTVYIGSYDGKFYALRAADGKERWNVSNLWSEGVTTSPAVAEGLVFFGSDDHRLYAVDAETGHTAWTFPTGSEVFSSPAVANGLVYFGSDDYRLYAVHASNGTECWNFSPSSHYFKSSPAVADGVVYIGSWNARLYAVDALTGTERWNFTTGNSVYSSPAVVNGMVYFGSWDRKLYAVGTLPGPVVSGIAPDNGTAGMTMTGAVISGSGFSGNPHPYLDRPGQASVPFTVTCSTATSITGNIVIPLGAGFWDVLIEQDGSAPGRLPGAFFVSNPAPAVTSLTPKKAAAGTRKISLVVKGTGFVPGSTVQWNGMNRTTTYGSPAKLTAKITAKDLKKKGSFAVTVTNPAPGGGESNTVKFRVT